MPDNEHETLIARVPDDAVIPEAEATYSTTIRRSIRQNPWWIAAAAILFLALWGWREVGIRVAREHEISQQAEINRLEVENARLTQIRERMTADLQSLAAADAQSIELQPQKAAAGAKGRVFLNPARARAIAFFNGFAPNIADKTYQLWIVGGEESKVTSGGTFDVTESGNGAVTIENVPVGVKAFTVTLEPAGGSQQPTGEIYVSGNTGS